MPKENWVQSVSFFLLALLFGGFAVSIFYANNQNGPGLMNAGMAFIGLSLAASAWCGYGGIVASSRFCEQYSWLKKSHFVYAILTTVSGFAWMLLNSDVVVFAIVALSGWLWATLSWLTGIAALFLLRGYFFVYWLTQLLLIIIGAA